MVKTTGNGDYFRRRNAEIQVLKHCRAELIFRRFKTGSQKHSG